MVQEMVIGNRKFTFGRHTYVMGILNCTPDSFSDGGKYLDIDNALRHAGQMIDEGADLIDVGGESTRPGYHPVTAEEEIERIAPVIEKIKERFDIPVSADTCKSAVAAAAIAAGADLINDIWGLKHDEKMAGVIRDGKVACCLMHNRVLEKNPYRMDLVEEVLKDLSESVKIAKEAGIGDDRIILDPGIGFAKNLEQNLWMMKHLERMQETGYPWLLGTSRKSMIGLTLSLPADQRVEGTLATTVIGVMKGCAFVRVHDVAANQRAVRMTEAVINAVVDSANAIDGRLG